MTPSLCFMMACDKKYSSFIVPFVYFSSLFNKNAAYEFLIAGELDNGVAESIEKLKELLGVKITLRFFKDFSNAELLRFVEEPSEDYDYVYIGDIDIFILEDVLPFHIKRLPITGIVYDNVIRPNNKNYLSGLQFCTREYFKLTKKAREKYAKESNLKECNERTLLKIVNESGLKSYLAKDTNEFTKARPVHGVHVSLNRRPFAPKSPMSFTFGEYEDAFFSAMSTDMFKNKIYPLFTKFMKGIFSTVEKLKTH